MDSNLRVRAAIPIKKMQFDDIINNSLHGVFFYDSNI